MLTKVEKLELLYQDWEDCTRCPLHEERKNVVFGEGNAEADIMIIGEGPGDSEDRSGSPFIGPAGAILDKALTHANVSREDFWITNIVGCRPTGVELKRKDNEIEEVVRDRQPNKLETDACSPRLQEQIYIVDPILILALGKKATEILTGKPIKITQERGQVFEMTVPGKAIPTVTYPVLATLHPSYVNRIGRFDNGSPMHQLFMDIQKALVITNRLRGAYYGDPIEEREWRYREA